MGKSSWGRSWAPVGKRVSGRFERASLLWFVFSPAIETSNCFAICCPSQLRGAANATYCPSAAAQAVPWWMPSLKGNRWAAKLGVLKDESSALAMFNQKILKFPGNISLKRLHGSKLVEYSIKNYSTTIYCGRYGPPKLDSFNRIWKEWFSPMFFGIPMCTATCLMHLRCLWNWTVPGRHPERECLKFPKGFFCVPSNCWGTCYIFILWII